MERARRVNPISVQILAAAMPCRIFEEKRAKPTLARESARDFRAFGVNLTPTQAATLEVNSAWKNDVETNRMR